MDNKFVDLSGVNQTAVDGNPYSALIDGCGNNVIQIQRRYEAHRTARNKQQRDKFLLPNFPGFNIDPILLKLEDKTIDPGFADPRHCLVFWARPTQKIKNLIHQLQVELRSCAPSLWLMPAENLHMTVFELTHSKSGSEVAQLVESLRPLIPSITNYTLTHHPRLVKPMLSYDNAAVALSFLPAAGEASASPQVKLDDDYTYHHLRKDIYHICSAAGIEVNTRYVVPSAHLTIGRFLTTKDFSGEASGESGLAIEPSKLVAWIELLEKINKKLQEQHWSAQKDSAGHEDGEWIVGQEKGLDCRSGTLWYGGGSTIQLGKGV